MTENEKQFAAQTSYPPGHGYSWAYEWGHWRGGRRTINSAAGAFNTHTELAYRYG